MGPGPASRSAPEALALKSCYCDWLHSRLWLEAVSKWPGVHSGSSPRGYAPEMHSLACFDVHTFPGISLPACPMPVCCCCCCCRLGASELHVIASVMGGMAAQEAIKLLTGQFVPFRCA